MISVKTKGVDSVINKLAKLNETIRDDVKGIIEFSAGKIEEQAINNAPANGDVILLQNGKTQKTKIGINQYIYLELQNGGFKAVVGVRPAASKLAAYVEFGTGISAKGYVPTLEAPFQKIAKSYYINGKGTIMAKPFLIPAYMKYRELFIKEIKEYAKNIKL